MKIHIPLLAGFCILAGCDGSSDNSSGPGRGPGNAPDNQREPAPIDANPTPATPTPQRQTN